MKCNGIDPKLGVFAFRSVLFLHFVWSSSSTINPLPNNAPARTSIYDFFMAAQPRVLTVAHDGCADFCTVQEAIDAVPFSNTCRTIIRVSPGIYKQPLYVPKTKNFITFAGLNPETTILTWDNTATKINHHQVRFSSVFFFIISYLGFLLILRICNLLFIFPSFVVRLLVSLELGLLVVEVQLWKERISLLRISRLRILPLKYPFTFKTPLIILSYLYFGFWIYFLTH